MAEIGILQVQITKGAETLEQLAERMKDKKAFLAMASKASQTAAEGARKKMSRWLAPGHKFNVGATGDASKSLEVRTLSFGMNASAQVFETSKHNMFIRRGFRAIKHNRNMPENKLREWLGAKNITLDAWTDEEGNPYEWQVAKYVRQRSKSGKWYGRAMKKTPEQEKAQYALKKSIEREGSKDSHWTDLYPEGKGRFDYPVYLMRRDTTQRDAISYIMEVSAQVYIRWLSSGRRIPIIGEYNRERDMTDRIW